MKLGDDLPHQISLFQMEVACHLVTGPVYLAGETLTCQVSVVNNAANSQVFRHLFVGHNINSGSRFLLGLLPAFIASALCLIAR